jgi:two-component system, OmpR family, alkaline phosphatase synthesis response regulator PhoP
MAKILVVEDEITLQKAMMDALDISGYETAGANDGEQGLEMIKSEKPDLVLLDIILPKMNGFDVLKAIKADETTKKIPVIMLTNLESSGDIEKALTLGAMTYLVKTNYELDEIVKRVKDALAKSQQT